ncbi:hypothetical protein MNBD_IGNAVI01-225 [hydrothermal vent metagenome]|uniref:Uncharacterized protein n=1 Tax=hydrothermal vent metagenome TaxID=652676 RepID=A0A3B1DGP2_9ZZZZ
MRMLPALQQFRVKNKIIKTTLYGVIKDIYPVIFLQIVVEHITNLFYNKLGSELLILIRKIDIMTNYTYIYSNNFIIVK